MPSKTSVGRALRLARLMAAMSQDDMTVVSSRTFVSSIERGLKSPTLEKLSQIGDALQLEAAAIVVVAALLEVKNREAKMAEICEVAGRILAQDGI
jgi:transcriptional regulator with XRE-family HTH domain